MSKILQGSLAKVPQSLRQSIARSKTDYRRLGESGLRVSNPILGTLGVGSSKWLPWVLDEDRVLKTAYDTGINTWDTANVYSNGESEAIIGKALRKYNIPRQKVVIMTKCYRVLCDPEAYDPGSSVTMHHDIADLSKDYVNQWGLSRSAIINAVEGSLRRLDTSYIDVLQIHRFDSTVPPEETMRTLDDLVRGGLVRYLGASSMRAYQFITLQHVAEKNNWTKFISMQNHYNMLYREEEREMIPFCKSTGVGLMSWGALASGLLTRCPFGVTGGSVASPDKTGSDSRGSMYDTGDGNSIEIVRRVSEIADKRGWPMSHVSLAWLSRRITAPVIGFRSPERILEALEARGKLLEPEEEQYLEDLYVPRAVQGHD